ncbi:MAG: zinc ribbon domain-containing protein [Bacillus sp. (in: Bacteria)]|nr:zinc ribbon domain-containing protein [Bacillus sp. (in: firmicutes)]MCM1426437.1 zinc ribbon domain-containing protein [Eubacterium sp.]
MKWKPEKEPTEMERIQENIAQAEMEIQQRIFQLGQMYYEDNKEKESGSIEEKYYTIIDLIQKLDLNRMGFYKNKLRLEGQMICENCGSVISYGSVYCNICGKKADEKQEGEPAKMTAAMRKCAACGAELDDNSIFCEACGTKVE